MSVPNEAWQITSPGTLTLTDLGPLPSPGPNQVLLRLHAFSLNYRDKLVIDHSPSYPLRASPNLIPGSDGAGIVSAVGPNSRWREGDRVVIHPNTWTTEPDERAWKFAGTMGGGSCQGTFRRWMIVGDEQIFAAPGAGLELEEAAGMFTAGVTAWRALMRNGEVEIGEGVTVLTQGTGGVSCYGIMIAAAAGATVIATSSSDEKLDKARQLGATHLINYKKHSDWAAEVLKVTDGKGVDLVLDVVGAESMEQTIKATAFKGSIIVTGMLSKDPNFRVDILTDVLFGAKTSKFKGQLGAGSRQHAEELSAFMEKHQLHPPTAAMFDFEDTQRAVEALDNLTEPGKIVVRC